MAGLMAEPRWFPTWCAIVAFDFCDKRHHLCSTVPPSTGTMEDIDQLLSELEASNLEASQPELSTPPTMAPTTDSTQLPPASVEIIIPLFVTTNTKNMKSIFQSRKGPASPANPRKALSSAMISVDAFQTSTGPISSSTTTLTDSLPDIQTNKAAHRTVPPTKPVSAFQRRPAPLFQQQQQQQQIQRNQPPPPPKICQTCNEPIETPSFITTTHGKTYHPTHFTCTNPTCNRPLKGTTYIERDTDGSAYCKPCFTQLFSETCLYCRAPILDTCVKIGVGGGKTFHVDCFFLLNSAPFVEEAGKVYCLKDHEVLFARVCFGCGKKRVAGAGSAGASSGGEFVEVSKDRVFHLECFRCSKPGCGVLLSPNEFYQSEEGDAVCQMHYYQMQDAVCSACEKIVVGACVNALGKRYHRGCFSCTFCKKGLDSGGVSGMASSADKFKSKNGNPYCCLCHLKLFG
ncbi:hypothetical protein BDR26DRAFT_873593 [Obelidium mucronatum]|nr:hypothetical protein BDR26DRAFT_873593 [Obelidium mucronatum]